jgi:SAM-dependent methyltransferase
MGTNSYERYYVDEAGREYYQQREGNDLVGTIFARDMQPWIRPNDRVLDYGCGNGCILKALPNPVRAGFDLNDYARSRVRDRLPPVTIYDSVADIPRGRWDVVVLHHVLEHCVDPVAVLVSMRELLAQRGRLLLTIPLEASDRRLREVPLDLDHHLYCWNPTTMRNLLAHSGLSLRTWMVRTAARENLLQPLARFSWRAFATATWILGSLLQRRELTCVCESLESPIN